MNFKINDVKIPDIPAMFTTIIVGQEKPIPLFVDGAHAFVDQRHYVKLMGYDKPLNLRWEKSKFLFHYRNKFYGSIVDFIDIRNLSFYRWDKEADASEGVVESRRRKSRKTKKNL